MTVGELREMLENYDDDDEVRLATQPSWPFEYSIASTVAEMEPDDDGEEDGLIVYLAEETQLGYLPDEVSSQLGWK